MGILVLNAYGRLVPRRRLIEASLVGLGILLAGIALSGQISSFFTRASTAAGLPDMSIVTSLLSLVVGFAFFAGIAYAFVSIPSQTQLQEDLPGGRPGPRLRRPEHARLGRELPADPHRRADRRPHRDDVVLLLVALLIGLSGVASIIIRGPLKPAETALRADVHGRDPIASALGAELPRGRVRRRRRAKTSQAPRRSESPSADRRSLTPFPPTPPTRTLRWRRVAVVFTGGTISMRHDPVAGGYVPTLSGAEILAQVPGPRTRSPTSSRSTAAGRRPATSRSRRCSSCGRRSARRSPTPRSTASSSSRAPTRSRRPRSSSTCSTPATRRSS